MNETTFDRTGLSVPAALAGKCITGMLVTENNNYTPTGVVVVVVIVVAVAEIRTVKETVHATGLQATPHPPVIVWFRFISIGDKYKTKI